MNKFFQSIRKFWQSLFNKDKKHPYGDFVDRSPWLAIDTDLRNFMEACSWAVLGVLIITLAGIAASLILSNPQNLAGLIASLLAQISQQTGQMDYYQLIISFAVANIILLSIFIFFLFLMADAWSSRPASQGDLDDLRKYIHESNNIDGLVEILEDLQYKIRLIAEHQGIDLDGEEADETPTERTAEPG